MSSESGSDQLLVADGGHSSTQIGLFIGDTLVMDWRLSSSLSRTADEFRQVIRAFLEESGHRIGRGTRGVVCSVVPTLTGSVGGAFEALTGARALVVDGSLDLGIANRYADPMQVGPDRLANAIAARADYGAPAIVVDLGTATTFDVIDADGGYLGGAIAPGMRTSADVLFQRASRLPRVELAVPPRVIGRTTTESIQAGIVRGAASLVDGLVGQISAELGQAARVIATGGDAPLIGGVSRTVEVVDPTLTLRGLRLIERRLSSGPAPR
jgi:type III pantothenate kinase